MLTSTTQNQGLSAYAPLINATILKNVIFIASNGKCPIFIKAKILRSYKTLMR